MKQRMTWVTCFASVALLAACGGGGSDAPVAVVPPPPQPAPTPVTDVPATAGATSAAFTDYAVNAVGLFTNETAEPLGTDLVATAPGSETTEPIVIN